MEKALFGAGCFWGVEDFFLQVPGVSEAISGYAGGTSQAPTYKQVCAGNTNHAEVVEVTFDPEKVAYAALVDLFFKMHNPTQLNRQGPDFGTQYRSVIFTHGPEQARIAAVDKAYPTVVAIYGNDRAGGGSGVLYDPDGFQVAFTKAMASPALVEIRAEVRLPLRGLDLAVEQTLLGAAAPPDCGRKAGRLPARDICWTGVAIIFSGRLASWWQALHPMNTRSVKSV